MEKHVLFVQGAGQGAHKIDAVLADSLRQALGSDFEVHYPLMPNEDGASYEEWSERIESELSHMSQPVVLLGHSVGASILAKYVSTARNRKAVAGILLLESPFWGGDGWHYEGYEKLELPKDAATRFPKNAPVLLYHAKDDEIVPFEHLGLYAKLLPHARALELEEGGHQMNGDLRAVARDIKGLFA